MQTIISTEIGKIKFFTDSNHLIKLGFTFSDENTVAPTTPLAREVVKQLNYYLKHPKHHFDLPLAMHGTPFQQQVWRLLKKIPSGKTLTYSTLAEKLSSHARAIGGACRSNPIAIIVPCHRVIAKNGLGGYSGKTSGRLFEIKKYLLKLEQN